MSHVRRRALIGSASLGALAFSVAGGLTRVASAETPPAASGTHGAAHRLASARVAADPTDIPPPISRSHPVHHEITLRCQEVVADIEPGTSFRFMTFNGQVPGPMIRVRQGDSVTLTVHNDASSELPHSVDMHAVYATGGGAGATLVAPGETKTETFRAMYPGAFIYHCAVPGLLDQHISAGMFGMIVVEPPLGLPHVDREFYLGQHEVYTAGKVGAPGEQAFDFDKMIAEEPTYVLFNGAFNGFTPVRYGPIAAKSGEVVRVFMVCGGPNLSSSFHPIGNVWARAWPQGGLANPPLRYIQTQPVPPGSCFVGEMELPLAETINLVDHALTRYTRQGLLAQIEVKGEAAPRIFHVG